MLAAKRTGEIAGTEDGGVEGLGGLVVGDEDERGGIVSAEEEGEIEGARGCSEARDAATTGAAGEVAAGTFEGVRVFETREQIADKREDHR